MTCHVSKVDAPSVVVGVAPTRLVHLRVSPMLDIQGANPRINRIETFIVHLECIMLKLNFRDTRRLGEMQVRTVTEQDRAE